MASPRHDRAARSAKRAGAVRREPGLRHDGETSLHDHNIGHGKHRQCRSGRSGEPVAEGRWMTVALAQVLASVAVVDENHDEILFDTSTRKRSAPRMTMTRADCRRLAFERGHRRA